MAPTQYSSKLFQFVMRRSRHLSTQVSQTYRQATIAAKWGLESAAATVYGVWRWSQHRWQQLQLTAQETSSASAPPTARLLASVKAAAPKGWQAVRLRLRLLGRRPQPRISANTAIRNLLKEARSPASDILVPTQSSGSLQTGVRAIATDLTTGRLAWVTATDLVVLDRDAHCALAQKISEALAYAGQGLPTMSPSESRLIPWQRQARTTQILSWIWQAVLHFFHQNGQPLPPPPESLRQSQPDQALEPAAPAPAALSDQAASRQPAIAAPYLKSQLILWQAHASTAQIFSWIWQAVLHFFNPNNNPLAASPQPCRNPQPEQTLSSSAAAAALSGTVSQPPGQSAAIAAPNSVKPNVPVLPEPAPTSVSVPPPRWKWISSQEKTATLALATAASSTPSSTAETAQNAAEKPSMADWVDVSATPTGYSQSFLGWLLVSLDKVFTRIEQAVIAVWTKLVEIVRRYLF